MINLIFNILFAIGILILLVTVYRQNEYIKAKNHANQREILEELRIIQSVQDESSNKNGLYAMHDIARSLTIENEELKKKLANMDNLLFDEGEL